MTTAILLAVAACGLIVGFAVGATGLGGVLLVPALTLAMGIDVKRAVATALVAYLPSGAVALTLYGLRGSVAWRQAAFIGLGALPAAWLGAKAAGYAPPGLLEFVIGALLLGAGAYALRPPKAPAVGRAAIPPWTLLGLGAVASFGSALTGAGGAVILVPLLLLLETPVLAAIGLGQAIVVPIAGMASVSNVMAGLVDYALAAGLAVTLMIGIAVGTPVAHALPQARLRRLLGYMIVVAGAAMLVRQGVRLAAG
jgi:hypothetical protein